MPQSRPQPPPSRLDVHDALGDSAAGGAWASDVPSGAGARGCDADRRCGRGFRRAGRGAVHGRVGIHGRHGQGCRGRDVNGDGRNGGRGGRGGR